MFNIGESTDPLLLAIALPAAFAALLGYFVFYGRISDVYLGVITLTVTLILFSSVNSTAGPAPKHGGLVWWFQRHSGDPAAQLPRQQGRVIDLEGMFYLATAALFATYFDLLASRFGRIIVGIRENERRAEPSLGYDPGPTSLVTLLSAARSPVLLAASFANWGNFVSPTISDRARSAQIIIWVIVDAAP